MHLKRNKSGDDDAGGSDRSVSAIEQEMVASEEEKKEEQKGESIKAQESPPKKIRKKSLREQYMGRTPGKKSKTGREVIERMKKEGKIRGEKFEYKGKWYNIKEADMGHKIDAVTWWNKKGRFTGAKSPRVRRFMRNPNNYELQPASINRSNGAKLGETYLPPVIIN